MIVNICVALVVRMLARAAGQRAGMSMHQTIFVRTHLYMYARVYVRTVYALKLCCLILIAQLLLMRKHCGWLILPLPLNAARALMMRAFICIPHQRRLNGKAHVAAACGLRAFTFKLKKKKKIQSPQHVWGKREERPLRSQHKQQPRRQTPFGSYTATF